ncbi:PAS domain S-box protein [Xanthobacter sp. KR7-65]|uniref:PAS domain S-box protein n=1 Tax=Xanthobacter sp. KR7-65 TaxID=3156612 RepID=UPI0032B47C54
MRARLSFARIIAASIALVVLVASYWVYLEYSFSTARAVVLENARLRASQLSDATREQFAATLRATDFLLQHARRDFVQDPTDFQVSAAQVLALLPPLADAQLTIYDAEGKLVATSGVAPAPPNIAATAEFQAMRRSGADDALLVGVPVPDERPGHWSVPLARPLMASEGFAGVIRLLVSPRYLSREFALVGLGANDVVAAIHLPEGSYIARSSGIDGVVGRRVVASRPFLTADAPPAGIFTAVSSQENIERIYAWTHLREQPVVTVVGLSIADLMAPLNEAIKAHRRTNVIGTLAMVLLTAGLILLSLRDVRHHARFVEQEALYHALFNQNHSVKLVSDPRDGRILAANTAAAEFYGYSREQLSRMTLFQINCRPQEEISRLMTAVAEGEGTSFIFPHRLASGEIRMVEVFPGPVQFGGTKALYSIIHDVTSRFELERRLSESEARYRTIFEAMPAGVMVIDRHGTIAGWNEQALRLMHVDADALVSRSFDMYHRDGRRLSLEERPSMRCLSADIHDELYFVLDPEGRRTWININGRRFSFGDGQETMGAILTYSDITKVVQLEEAALISERVFEAAAEGIMVTDADGRVVRINPAFTEITGFGQDEILGRQPKVLSSGRHGAGFFREMFESLEGRSVWEGEITNRRKDGSLFVERAVISAIVRADGTLSGYVTLLSDITSRKKQEEEIWRRANFDGLTGLPNRTLLLDRANQALAHSRRAHTAVALLFIDLDRFKQVNDRWGHGAGDELLRLAAERISDALRSEDSVARFGGDEFVVLLPAVDGAVGATTVAEKILNGLRQPFHLKQGEASISASIGVAVATNESVSAETLILRADSAMYRGKGAGRSQVVVFSEQSEPAS